MLLIDSRSAEIEIVGTDNPGLRVSCTLEHAEEAREVKIQLSAEGIDRKLKVRGGPNGNVHLRIEVPRTTNLRIHAPAGVVKVAQVEGDKDIALYAGEITVSRVNDREYRYVEASAKIGEVNAKDFNVDKGGFFRTFTTENTDGKYRLRARVVTGSIVLN